jgi:NAD+ synthetase
MKHVKAIQNIRTELKNYIVKNNLKALIIGESGGIDSALCTVLAAPVCNELGIDLIGRSITIETNKPDEINRGKAIGENFCTDFKEVDLTPLYHQIRNSLEMDISADNDNKLKLRKGNVKARTRMIYLYDLAQKHKGMVLSTDNYTEFLLGFWTLHGDVGDFGMIQNLWKTEVYAIAQYLVDHELNTTEKKKALQDCINAVPTDGLGITHSDLDQLGAPSYSDVDQILKQFLTAPETLDSNHPVIQRHLKSGFKRINPLNLQRENIVEC